MFVGQKGTPHPKKNTIMCTFAPQKYYFFLFAPFPFPFFFGKSFIMSAEQKVKFLTQFEQEGKLQSARSVDGIVYSLWSLLPSFCNYPVDTAESFKGLEGALCTALQEEHEFRGIICSSLQTLIQQNKRILEGKGNTLDTEISVAEQQAVDLYTVNIAQSNLNALKSSALLRVLAGVYFKCSKDTAGILQVIRTFLTIFIFILLLH